MKVAMYVILFTVFVIVVFQLNSLFNVNDELVKKYAVGTKREEYLKSKEKKQYDEKGLEFKKVLKDSEKNLVNSVSDSFEKSKREEVVKFSKRYFDQVGRNYRVFYMKDERMVYLHRMWFDQVRTPSQVIKSDFPSIFAQEGCCFTAEKEFFMVIPGTPVYKQTGPYRFDR